MTSDISSAAFYRACDRWRPTLFVDETATAGQQHTLYHLLRSGTTRDAIAFRGGHSYRAFGAKVVAWTEMPNDDALNSRCITIPMRRLHERTCKESRIPTWSPPRRSFKENCWCFDLKNTTHSNWSKFPEMSFFDHGIATCMRRLDSRSVKIAELACVCSSAWKLSRTSPRAVAPETIGGARRSVQADPYPAGPGRSLAPGFEKRGQCKSDGFGRAFSS